MVFEGGTQKKDGISVSDMRKGGMLIALAAAAATGTWTLAMDDFDIMGDEAGNPDAF